LIAFTAIELPDKWLRIIENDENCFILFVILFEIIFVRSCVNKFWTKDRKFYKKSEKLISASNKRSQKLHRYLLSFQFLHPLTECYDYLHCDWRQKTTRGKTGRYSFCWRFADVHKSA